MEKMLSNCMFCGGLITDNDYLCPTCGKAIDMPYTLENEEEAGVCYEV